MSAVGSSAASAYSSIASSATGRGFIFATADQSGAAQIQL
jgi:hypothetical protein